MLSEAIAAGLAVDAQYVDDLAKAASYRYKSYPIKKRRGGTRLIHHPAKSLKAVQRWLAANVLAAFPVHPAAAGYVKGLNIADHARRHVGGRFLLHLDLRDFFRSIGADDIAAMLQANIERLPSPWSSDDTTLFVALVCRHGRLTVGAATSPALSNAICAQLDSRVAAVAGDDVVYTRYADDMYFSTSLLNVLDGIPGRVEDVLTSLEFPRNLALNHDKTRHSSLKRQRRVTGLILSSQGQISVGRRFKRTIRGQIHQLDALNPEARSRLAGWLAFARDVEPEFIDRLVLKYGEKAILATRAQRNPE